MGLFDRTPDRVSVYEVSPRDGLQNERATVPLADKIRLIDALVAAGLERIEITSFVSPKWIPQLADADDVARIVNEYPNVVYSALCPNEKGLARARGTRVAEIAVFMSASETHNRKNVNKSMRESLEAAAVTTKLAKAENLRVRGYVSTAWGCPYEGDVPIATVARIARQLVDFGCYQISLGDTIGAGTPRQTAAVLDAVLAEVPLDAIALHMHDTRGTALANIVVGLQYGVRTYDASIGGLGGCPYAPGAAGNVATEDLVYMLRGMGVETGVDLERLVEAGRAAESIVGRTLPSKVLKAGVRSLRA